MHSVALRGAGMDGRSAGQRSHSNSHRTGSRDGEARRQAHVVLRLLPYVHVWVCVYVHCVHAAVSVMGNKPGS